MNAAEYLKILREQDAIVDQRSAEEQIQAYKKEQEDVFKLAHAISLAIGNVEKVEAGSLLQDANYRAEILMHISDSKGIWPVLIRLSEFGNFVTIIDEKLVLKEKRVETLKEIFRQHNFIYIPMNVLETKYDGVQQIVGKKWFDRFFDY